MIIIKNIKINKKEEKIKIKGNERKGMDDVSAWLMYDADEKNDVNGVYKV